MTTESILIKPAKAKIHIVADTKYIGANPVFAPIFGGMGEITGYRKVLKGVPFRRL